MIVLLIRAFRELLIHEYSTLMSRISTSTEDTERSKLPCGMKQDNAILEAERSLRQILNLLILDLYFINYSDEGILFQQPKSTKGDTDQ